MISRKKKKEVLEYLCKTPVIEAACVKVGIGRTTLHEWRKKDPIFDRAMREAISEGTNVISDMAILRIIAGIKNDNVGAAALWLRNNHPDFANKLQIEGKMHLQRDLTTDEAAIILEALKRRKPLEKAADLENHEPAP